MDPVRKVPVLSAWWSNQNKDETRGPEETIPDTAAITVGRMGGGSDHVVFQNHLGIPSMAFGFGGPGGIYHSYYDNFDWMKRFADPGFYYHAAGARLAALAAMRMANADVVPFVLTPYADEVLNQLTKIESRYKAAWPETTDLETVKSLAAEWKALSQGVDDKIAGISDPTNLKRINALLVGLERSFAIEQGLPGRDWYKHRIVTATGYESVGLPGIVQAAGRGDWDGVAKEIQILETILERVKETTSRIHALL
jgi:N-acetylated-alpha-linked acidic dipeptidase